MGCPDENTLSEYVDCVLDGPARQRVEQHIGDCVACRTVISDLARMQHAADAATDDRTLGASLGPPTGASAPTIAAVRQRRRTSHIVPGTLIGEYEVKGVLGAGGMGIVFAAIHPRIGKKAAIKILQRDLAGDQNAIARFENEARAVNAIGHPNIVDIFAFGELPNGDPYYVMEQVDGTNLHDWIHAHGPVSLDRAMPILRQVCDALTAAHERGIVHRDLKPGNIMVGGSDDAPRIKVLDFGLAKMARDMSADDLTNPGVAIGTPAFMPPEQFMGHDVDQRSDVYALGVLVYQMLTGTYPFQGATPSALEEQHLYHTPKMPSQIVNLPAAVDRIIDRALAKNIDTRYPTVAELRRDLERCLARTPARGPSATSDELQSLGERPTVEALPEPATAVERPPVVPEALETASVRKSQRRMIVLIASSAAAFVIAWAIFGRSSAPREEHLTVVPPAVVPAPATPPAPAADPPSPAVVGVSDKTPTPASPVATAKPPARHGAKPVRHATTKHKPAAASGSASSDDDNMLLEGGAVLKQP